jgi:predicted aconitase
MELTKDEDRMLSGEYGEGYRRAMEILVGMGEFYDAKRLVPVTMAFLIEGPSAATHGEAPRWLKEIADFGTTFKCPIPLVPLDSSTFWDHDVQKQLGAIFSLGGAGHPRHPFCLPVYGQHIVADGTAVTHYMNSYVGARANSECFLGQYSAALVGKTPEYGFHLTENRCGKVLFDVKTKLKNETDWSALGYYISFTLGKRYWDVPVISGIDRDDIANDDLVVFCSAIPAYGAVVHSLLLGVSPEAHTMEEAFGGNKPKETFVVGHKEIQSIYDRYSSSKNTPDMVSFGGFGVNLSIRAVYEIARLLDGKKVSGNFPVVATIDGLVRDVSDKAGLTDILKKAGVKLTMKEVFDERGVSMVGFANNPVISAKKMGWNTLVFIDAKSCHYIGNQDIEPVLKNIQEAARIAITGKIEG